MKRILSWYSPLTLTLSPAAVERDENTPATQLSSF